MPSKGVNMSSKFDLLCEILLEQNVKLMTVLQGKTCSWKKKNRKYWLATIGKQLNKLRS